MGTAQIESATTKFILRTNELSTQCQGGTTVRGAWRETFLGCTGCIPAFRDAAPVGAADVEAGRYREFDSQSEQARRLEEPRAGICTVGQARRGVI